MALTSGKYVITNGAPSGNIQTMQSDAYGPSDLADIISRLDNAENLIAVNTLRDSIDAGWSVLNMVEGIADEYEDQTGVDGGSTDATYDSINDFYGNTDEFALLVQSGGDSNGSTTFTDLGSNSFTVTANGDAQHSTAQAKFGTSSMLFDGTGDYLSIPDDEDFNFGSGDFYVAAWIRLSDTTGTENIVGQWNTGGGAGRSWFLYANGANIVFDTSTSGTATTTSLTGTSALSATTWHYVEASRSGSNLYLFVDGTEVASNTSFSETLLNSTNDIGIGAIWPNGTPNFYLNGYIEEVAVVKGVAGNTSGYTAPTVPTAIGGTDSTLESTDFTPVTEPDEVRMVLLLGLTSGFTLNTDLVLSVSRDGGTTWTAATMSNDGKFSSTVDVISTGAIDISAQPSGTSMRYKVVSSNSKSFECHGAWMQWS